MRGTVAVVTGGNQGIGKAIAHAMAVAGASIVVSARTAGDASSGITGEDMNVSAGLVMY